MANRDELYADLLLDGGPVVTMSADAKVAGSVAVKHGRIVAVGAAGELRDLIGPRTTVVGLAGRTLLPGLVDCHMHLATDAARTEWVDVRDRFTGIRTVDGILAAMAERAATLGAGEWVGARGSPLQELRLAERRRLTRHDLDPALPDHPAYLAFGSHVTQANSLALRAVGIDRNTADPPGGVIERDPATGEPTGVLTERAQYLVRPRRPAVSQERLEHNILVQLQRCLRRGATTIHDIVATREEILAYTNLANRGLLPVRVHLLVRVIESAINKESLLDLGLVHGFGSSFLKLGGIKMSVDGGSTGRSGAFEQPLAGEAPGVIRIDQAELDDTIRRYHELGMRICVHAVGDRAHGMVFDAFGKALAEHPRPDHRHRVEHLGNWMFTADELTRTLELGLIPMPNPTGLRYSADLYRELLGPQRMRWSFRFGTILRAGIPASFPSDGPSGYSCDPLRDAGAMVSRRTESGTVLNPEEAVTVDQALRAQTVNAAYAGFEENRLGTIEVGKLADFAVLGTDPYRTAPEEFGELPVVATVVGGVLTQWDAVSS